MGSLIALNGLRISEALGADINDLEYERGHRTLKILRKGGKHAVIPLAPRTSRALDSVHRRGTTGPIFVGSKGGPIDRDAGDRTVKRLVRRAGITKRISPHSLRHRFITVPSTPACRCGTCRRRPVTPNPRTTMRYDRGRGSLDRHATYVVASFLAGASR